MKKLDNDYVFICENLEEEMKLIDEFAKDGCFSSDFQRKVLKRVFHNSVNLLGVETTDAKFSRGSLIIFPIKGINIFVI